MENVILVICFLCMIFDFLKNKKIFSPMCIFNGIWFITLLLYSLKLSYLQQDLSDRTLYLFLLNIIGFNIVYSFISLFKKKNVSFSKKKKKSKYTMEDRLRIVRYIIIVVFLIEVIYSHGTPLIWKLIGSSSNYFDYGIPSLHGAFNGLIICFGAYSLFKNKKDFFLCFMIGVLILSRQVILSMIIEAIIFNLFQKKHRIKKVSAKKYVLIVIAVLLFFSILGNFRSGEGTMNEVFQAKEEYVNLPDSIKWTYSYMTFSISNFNNLVSMTDGGINHGATMVNQLVPTVLLNVFNVEVKYRPYYLVSPNFTVSTSLPEVYLDFGEAGMLIYGVFLAFVGNSLYKSLKNRKTDSSVMKYSVYVHNVVLFFFSNMFIYLPVVFQFVYIPILFKEEEYES